MSSLEKAVIGCLGGLAAVCVKFLGQDFDLVVNQWVNLDEQKQTSLIIGYVVITPILVFLGGLVAWASEESKRLRLLAIAVAAPALITTYAGGTKSPVIASYDFELIESAYAQDPNEAQQAPRNLIDQIGDGVKIFFGYGKNIDYYWVVVGSHNDRSAAEAHVRSINEESADLRAFVGIENDAGVFPVIVGDAMTLSEARKVREEALQLDSVDGAFLSKARF